MDRCGLDVDSVWIPFPYTSDHNVDPPSRLALYNNIRGVRPESTSPPPGERRAHLDTNATLYWVPVVPNGTVPVHGAVVCVNFGARTFL